MSQDTVIKNINNITGTVSLPTGASTEAKQPALGTAGSASSDVITVQGIASMTALKVDGSAVTQPVSGTVTANAGTNLNTSALALESGGNLATVAGATKLEDAASADGDRGMPALAVRKATPANTSGADGDYEFLQMSAGRLWTSSTIDAALPAGTNAIGKLAANSGVDIGDVDVLTMPDAVATGKAAHDAAVSGNPVLTGREARSTRGTAVNNGDVVREAGDLYGRALTIRPFGTQTSSAGTAITTATNTSIVAAPLAGNHLRIFRLHAQNSSATATWLYWTEGSGGTKKYPMYLAQNQIISLNIGGEWELPTATALFISTATTGANIEWHVGYETVAD